MVSKEDKIRKDNLVLVCNIFTLHNVEVQSLGLVESYHGCTHFSPSFWELQI